MTQTTQPLTLATLQQLYALATSLTYSEIGEVQSAVLALPVEEAIVLARGFSRRRVTSRAAASRSIARRLSERKGRHERGEEIAKLARQV
jgi:hypothetical protein